MPNSRPYVDWPEFNINRPTTSPPAAMSDNILDLEQLSFDELAAIDANVEQARAVVQYLMAAVERHMDVDHMCGVVCVDKSITRVMDQMNLDGTRLVLLTLLKDIETASRESDEGNEDT
jgi:hypothetical protein